MATEVLRTLSFDASILLHQDGVDSDDFPLFIDSLKDLSLVVQRLGKANETNINCEDKLRRRLREEEQLRPVSEKGITPETMAKINRALGIV